MELADFYFLIFLNMMTHKLPDITDISYPELAAIYENITQKIPSFDEYVFVALLAQKYPITRLSLQTIEWIREFWRFPRKIGYILDYAEANIEQLSEKIVDRIHDLLVSILEDFHIQLGLVHISLSWGSWIYVQEIIQQKDSFRQIAQKRTTQETLMIYRKMHGIIIEILQAEELVLLWQDAPPPLA